MLGQLTVDITPATGKTPALAPMALASTKKAS